MILEPFDENGFAPLIAEIPDARFLLQWAGPQYAFPLDVIQLQKTVEEARSPHPTSLAFSAVLNSQTIGHIQIMNIDLKNACCTLGRVMIFKEHRGKGWGEKLVTEAVGFAFDQLKVKEIRLSVFDFNAPAVRLYNSLGFMEHECVKGARSFQGDPWNLIRMVLTREAWTL